MYGDIEMYYTLNERELEVFPKYIQCVSYCVLRHAWFSLSRYRNPSSTFRFTNCMTMQCISLDSLGQDIVPAPQ